MKYTPKVITENPNVTKSNPLIELFWLVGALVFFTGVIFISLGLITDWAVSKTSPEIENLFASSVIEHYEAQPNVDLQIRLDKIVANLPKDSVLRQYDFTVYLEENDSVNAIALPGGNIVVYSGLMDIIESENELAMVLSHELGHFAARDHLRGIGRGLGIAVISTFLFGVDSEASEIIAGTALSYQAQYSQDQEEKADLYGLNLLVQFFQHAGGATDFFKRIAKQSEGKHNFLSSHPNPTSRVDKINQKIKEKGYLVLAVEPLEIN